jgi:predicted enzyme related to lactoylglutathione lyase
MELIGVEIDALDVRRAASFWARALGWEHRGQSPGRAEVRHGGGGGPALRFVRADRAKTAKNRLHLDLAGGPDIEAEVARLLALGAVRTDIGQGDVPWHVLSDPEGNEFCVLPRPAAAPGLWQICQDAADAQAQGRFWAAATGGRITDRGDWGIRIRTAPAAGGAGPDLVMGPPAAPKAGPNRLRFLLAARDPAQAGTFTDPEGNEYRVHA